MAARRISKSAIDWTKFATRISADETELFKALKSKSGAFFQRVMAHPESLPKIDFAYYKKNLASANLVDQFEKSYAAVEIPYPKDKDNVLASIEKDSNALKTDIAETNKNLQEHITLSKQFIKAMDEYLPDPLYCSPDEMVEYFPQEKIDHDKPVRWPYTPQGQPGMRPNEVA